MGEQRPMDTIKAFVAAVWENDSRIAQSDKPDPTRVWSKPDQRTGSLELRRISTRESIESEAFPQGVRTDFYELYWADLSAGSTWEQFVSWVRYLLFRPWSKVPHPVRTAWLALWALSIAAVTLAALSILPEKLWDQLFPPWFSRWIFVAVFAALTALVHRVATATFGRVVRYTRSDPANIAARAAIRKRGLDLLEALHDGDRYGRIVIVAHSLGTMLAYDLLSYFWAQRQSARTVQVGTEAFRTLCELEASAAKLEHNPADDAALRLYRRAQRKLRLELASRSAPSSPTERDSRWLISDFVTLGSPLTHAEFLIAESRADLEGRQAARELPTAPPFREPLDAAVLAAARATAALPIADPREATRLMAFPDMRDRRAWILHHAAPFAAVRWINLYDPARRIFLGDIISGPLQSAFGPAVIDVDVSSLRGAATSFSHNLYWDDNAAVVQLEALRASVNLLDEEEPAMPKLASSDRLSLPIVQAQGAATEPGSQLHQ
jgi:hypothetical protein